MKIYKFGGASVRDAAGIKNVLQILQKTGVEEKLLVISAMGKTTNALEKVVNAYLDQHSYVQHLVEVKEYHHQILLDLFANVGGPPFQKVKQLFDQLENFLDHNKSNRYDFIYDQVVSFGELISTSIVSSFFELEGVKSQLLDARNLIKTDSTYRDGSVQWEETQQEITQVVNRRILTVTQGFIGSDDNNFTTTLGREGSDYSAAIFAYCLNATELTIWKDVPGVMNADPKLFTKIQLLEQISYEEAIELAFYGASVIHPKTLQPLQRKEIPLFVKSFLQPEGRGTTVTRGQHILPLIPCFIVKNDQVLISLSSLDFSFMVEENISEIFALFHKYQIRVNLIQNSAISFSVCVDNKFDTLEKLITHLKARYNVTYHTGVSLFTIRHFNESAVQSIEDNKEILLKQSTKATVQLVSK